MKSEGSTINNSDGSQKSEKSKYSITIYHETDPRIEIKGKIKLVGKLLLFPVPLTSDKPTCGICVGNCGLNDNTIMHLSIRGVSIKKKTAQGALIEESEINSGDV